MGLPLSPDDVAALERRTEGWIAALQLAALSITGRSDPSAFIAEFAGDDRYIVDYLVEEVLEQQPESIRRFLLETSILDRLTRSAVRRRQRAATTARTRWRRSSARTCSSSRSTIAVAGTAITTCSPTCSPPGCRREQPALIPALHRRASDWFQQHGDEAGAIEHALAAGTWIAPPT